MWATPSCFAISPKFSGLLLKRRVEVREITFSSAIFDNRVRISSWMPSAKYALSGSWLRFSNGKTAIDFGGNERAPLGLRNLSNDQTSPNATTTSRTALTVTAIRGADLTAGHFFGRCGLPISSV